MRRVALGGLFATVGLAVVGTATALSTHVSEEFDRTLTLAGGPDAARPAPQPAVTVPAYIDDPDAPIATARYGGERSRSAASVEAHAAQAVAVAPLAGGPPPTIVASAEPAMTEVREPAAPAVPASTTATPAPRAAARLLAEAPAPRRQALALKHVDLARRSEKAVRMEINDQPLPFTPMGLQSSNVKRLTLSAASKGRASAEDLRRGRWLVYIASSSKAYGMNLVRAVGNWRNVGIEERLARFGSKQLGVGWRTDNRQVSLTATRRKLNTIDYGNRDTVVGVTVTVRTPARPRA